MSKDGATTPDCQRARAISQASVELFSSSVKLSGGGQEGSGGGGGNDASSDESGMSASMSAGRAAQMMPLLVGRGPDGAVWAIGDGRL